jgi:hypothetical protein
VSSAHGFLGVSAELFGLSAVPLYTTAVKIGEAAILFPRQETAGGREYFGARCGMAS